MQVQIDKYNTLVDVLHERAINHPDRTAFIYLIDGEAQEEKITYGALHQRICQIAGGLQQISQKGDRAMMLFPSDLNFMVAFLSCLYAGVVAVPAVVPPLNRPAPRLQSIVGSAGATIALTTPDVLEKLDRRLVMSPGLDVLRWMDLDELAVGGVDCWKEPKLSGDTLAFLQYTSGSTADPKGVMISHNNLLYTERVLMQVWERDENATIVNWMPLHHDGGLIGMALQALYTGATCVLMSAVDFMQKPVRWLQAISHYQAHTSAGPNFSYDLCTRTVTDEQCQSLELSSWRVAVDSAEPVRADTVRQFIQRFQPYGLLPETLYPCYGLAEGTLFVTGGLPNEAPLIRSFSNDLLANEAFAEIAKDPKKGRELVSSGRNLHNQQIAIVDPDNLTQLEMGNVGEIWISSPAVAMGYWGDQEASVRTFQARISGVGDKVFLRTGDLGFIHEEELYITGRHKDLIIIQGNNYYPQDIEALAVESHPALEDDGCAAFSIDVDGEERLVIMAEIKRTFRKQYKVEEIVDRICLAVARTYGVQVYAIAILKPMRLPKTTSGKVQRFACRSGFLDGDLQELERWVAERPQQVFADLETVELEEIITRAFQEVLGLNKVGQHDNFFDLGGDSLSFVELCTQIERQTGRYLQLNHLIQTPTIASMLAGLKQNVDGKAFDTRVAAHKKVKVGPIRIAREILFNSELTFGQRISRLVTLTRDKAYLLGKGIMVRMAPYRRTNTLINMICAQPVVPNVFYRRQTKLLQSCFDELDIADHRGELLQQSLAFNSWRRWRIAALSSLSKRQFEQLVEIRDIENFRTSLARGRGVILLHAHTVLAMLDLLILDRHGITDMMVVGNRPQMIELLGLGHYRQQFMLGDESLTLSRIRVNASQLLAGRQTLERGGVLSIAADGYRGNKFVRLNFHGRMRPFGTGFAELALTTGASALPVRLTLDLEGRVNLRFYPALKVCGDGHQEQVESLVRGYAEWLSNVWIEDLGNIALTHIRKFMNLPGVAQSSDAYGS